MKLVKQVSELSAEGSPLKLGADFKPIDVQPDSLPWLNTLRTENLAFIRDGHRRYHVPLKDYYEDRPELAVLGDITVTVDTRKNVTRTETFVRADRENGSILIEPYNQMAAFSKTTKGYAGRIMTSLSFRWALFPAYLLVVAHQHNVGASRSSLNDVFRPYEEWREYRDKELKEYVAHWGQKVDHDWAHKYYIEPYKTIRLDVWAFMRSENGWAEMTPAQQREWLIEPTATARAEALARYEAKRMLERGERDMFHAIINLARRVNK